MVSKVEFALAYSGMPSAECCKHLADAVSDNFHEPVVRGLDDDTFDGTGVQHLLIA